MASDIGAGCSPKTCQRRLNTLVDLGILKKQTSEEPRTPNSYQVDYGALEEAVASAGYEWDSMGDLPLPDRIKPTRNKPSGQSDHGVGQVDQGVGQSDSDHINTKQDSSSGAHAQDEPDTDPDDTLIDDDWDSDLPPLESVPKLEDLNRDPLPEPDRVSRPEFQRGWQWATGLDWGQSSEGSSWHMSTGASEDWQRRATIALAYFTESELREALKVLRDEWDGDRASGAWRFMKGVLGKRCGDTRTDPSSELPEAVQKAEQWTEPSESEGVSDTIEKMKQMAGGQ